MKIRDGVKKLKGRPVDIPGCGRDDLPEYFKEMGFKRGVEVGVFEGDYTEILAKSGLEIYGVDPWLDYEDYVYGRRNQDKMDGRYEKTMKRLAPYPNVKIIRKMSMDAVKDFEDYSLDFVYIDGNHRFKFIAEDLCEWAPKLKMGGVLCGHDYAYFKHRFLGGGCQVKEVVDAFALAFELDFWVLGRKQVIEGEKRDQYRSWMIIKTWKNA
jgi:hypothetical protein